MCSHFKLFIFRCAFIYFSLPAFDYITKEKSKEVNNVDVLKERYTITELSEYLNVTDHTLRYYEKEFNLPVPKDERGRRYYKTELANIMYQIKSMRDQGLEIKAIRKILQAENIISEPPSATVNENISSVVPYNNNSNSLSELKSFFVDFKGEIVSSVNAEVSTAKEFFAREINKSKLELGACLENNIRRMEAKMDKHFQDVDLSIGKWREKNKPGFVKRLFNKAFK
jgi:DNA-binding transcriptional MerR regulator